MEEKWKRFLFRALVTCAGAAYSYLSSITMEDFAVKMLAWVIIQAFVGCLAELPVETTGARVRTKKVSSVRKLLSWL